MECERNDDVTYYALFIACITACEKVSRYELVVASMQRALRERNSLAFRKQKSKFVDDWCNRKGIQSAYIQYDSDFSKCKRSLSAWYHATSTLNTASVQMLSTATLTLIVICDITVLSRLSTLNFIFTV